jgi:hypothetical protein
MSPAIITWPALCEIEPELLKLELAMSRAMVPTEMPEFWRQWSHGWKPILESLAGWHARRPELRTEAAYHVAYDHLWRLWKTVAEQQAVGGATEARLTDEDWAEQADILGGIEDGEAL